MEVIEEVTMIPFSYIRPAKISGMIWDALCKYHVPAVDGDCKVIILHGMKIVQNKKGMVRIYDLSHDRLIPVRNKYLLYLFFKKLWYMDDPSLAILPVALWKKKHAK